MEKGLAKMPGEVGAGREAGDVCLSKSVLSRLLLIIFLMVSTAWHLFHSVEGLQSTQKVIGSLYNVCVTHGHILAMPGII